MLHHGQSFFGVLLDVVPPFIALAVWAGFRRTMYFFIACAVIAATVGWAISRAAGWMLRRSRRITALLLLIALAACAAPKTENTATMPTGDYRVIPNADHWQPSEADIAAATAVSVVRP